MGICIIYMIYAYMCACACACMHRCVGVYYRYRYLLFIYMIYEYEYVPIHVCAHCTLHIYPAPILSIRVVSTSRCPTHHNPTLLWACAALYSACSIPLHHLPSAAWCLCIGIYVTYLFQSIDSYACWCCGFLCVHRASSWCDGERGTWRFAHQR